MDEQSGKGAENGAEHIGNPIVKICATPLRREQLMPFVGCAEQGNADDGEKDDPGAPPVRTEDKVIHEQHAADGEGRKMSGFVVEIEVELLELVTGK